MKATATVTHGPMGWKEEAFQQTSETEKMTEVKTGYTYKGEWEGQSEVRMLMTYTPAGPVYYVGYERFEGTLGGKKGTFGLEITGVYQDNEAQINYKVVPGSGTGELAGLSGSGKYGVGHQEQWPAELEYSL